MGIACMVPGIIVVHGTRPAIFSQLLPTQTIPDTVPNPSSKNTSQNLCVNQIPVCKAGGQARQFTINEDRNIRFLFFDETRPRSRNWAVFSNQCFVLHTIERTTWTYQKHVPEKSRGFISVFHSLISLRSTREHFIEDRDAPLLYLFH